MEQSNTTICPECGAEMPITVERDGVSHGICCKCGFALRDADVNAGRRAVRMDELVRLPFQFVESCAVNGLLSRRTWRIAFHAEPVWRIIFRLTPAKWICEHTAIGDWITEMYGSSINPNAKPNYVYTYE